MTNTAAASISYVHPTRSQSQTSSRPGSRIDYSKSARQAQQSSSRSRVVLTDDTSIVVSGPRSGQAFVSPQPETSPGISYRHPSR